MIKQNKMASETLSSPRVAVKTADIDQAIPARRNWFYKVAAWVIGGLVGVVPAGIGLAAFLDPWLRQPKLPKSGGQSDHTGGQEGFIRVASLTALTVGGMPQRFPVIADQLDAWNFSPNQPIGAVFLQRVGDDQIRCFNATCPHAGCSVACNGQAYVCPCHNSSFHLDGQRRTAGSGMENPSPRNLDDLEIDPVKLVEGEVWVRFQNFYTGWHDKIPKT